MEFTRGNRKLLSTGARTDYPQFLHLLVGHFYAVSDRYSAKRSEGTDDWLLVATMQGRGRFGDGRGRLITQPQQLVLISPGTPHDYGALPNDDPWGLLLGALSSSFTLVRLVELAKFTTRCHDFECRAFVPLGEYCRQVQRIARRGELGGTACRGSRHEFPREHSPYVSGHG